ncbi:hypothetical protein MNBD_PLANCTO02-2994 [hydrothermal vent metagenome]|uniref:Cytochrome c domain-containing protein n=1 Tax=hydrothermal vent metagenome TaxID=652676 RepID=A0A3B1DVF5_9ZZZZ
MLGKLSLLWLLFFVFSLTNNATSNAVAAEKQKSSEQKNALQQEAPPRSLDPRLKIELFAENPQIATPTGIDVDESGRVWVIESNTHFPPEGYQRHKSDRIFVMSDSNGDGKADKIVTFTDGLTHTMSIAVQPTWLKLILSQEKKEKIQTGNSIYVATRKEIFLFQDTNNDLKADSKKSVIRLETNGVYPHNGIAGFAFGADGWMYFGLGENLGVRYKIIGADGKTYSGEGDGGSMFRCRPDGTKLTRFATGFWNPHASCVDAFGRLFTVDNDPHSRPPCRLLHTIQGGNYGYQRKFGSRGVHPFISWNGEIPGTLPMVAGTGEAPSGIVAYESKGLPKEYVGNLLSTSWGDHRIERFRLKPKGASFTSKLEPLIVGGENFRPVGIATAPDGSLYVSDWVLREYKVHGKGRIWHISMKKPVKQKAIDTVLLNEKSSLKILKRAVRSPHLPRRRLAALLLAQSDKRFLMGIIRGKKVPVRTRYEALAAWKHQKDHSEDRLISMQRATSNNPPYNTFHTEVSRYSGERPQVMAFLELLKNPGKSDPEYLRLGVESVTPLVKVLARNPSKVVVTLLNKMLKQNDPFVLVAVVQLIEKSFDEAAYKKLLASDASLSEQLQLAILLAARKEYPQSASILKIAIARQEVSLQREAVQWIAEEKLKQFRPQLLKVLENRNISNRLFESTLAALQILEGKKRAQNDQELGAHFALTIAVNKQFPPAIRARALQIIPPNYKKLKTKLLRKFLQSKEQQMILAALRTLQIIPRGQLAQEVRRIAADSKQSLVIRADAIMTLATMADKKTKENETLLLQLATNENKVLKAEALRSLRGLAAQKNVRELMKKQAAGTDKTLADLAKLALRQKTKPSKVNELFGKGNALTGRRIFFHSQSAGCFKCHTVNRRGGKIGPDLSLIARTMDRKKLAESIIEPSREIAPQFTQWSFVLLSGKIHTGMVIGEANKNVVQLGLSDGKIIRFKRAEIDERVPQKKSVMPEKLPELLTKQEFIDLLAFLESLK